MIETQRKCQLATPEMVALARGLYLGTVWTADLEDVTDTGVRLIFRHLAWREPQALKMLDDTVIFVSSGKSSKGKKQPHVLHFVTEEDAEIIFQAASAAVNLRASRKEMKNEVVWRMTEEFVEEMMVQIICDEQAELRWTEEIAAPRKQETVTG